MRVGFAGLGRMGEPMARNLAQAGHPLTLWTRAPGKAAELAEAWGASHAPTPRALAQSSDVVVTMLADDAASEAVHGGPEGLLAAGGVRCLVQMGTHSPDHIAALRRAAPPGVQVIDAPVSGATEAARRADLLIMAGCTEAQAAPLEPVLRAMGRQVICLGQPGAGAVMKLAVNTLIHGLNQTLAEALSLTGAAGIAPATAHDVIEASAAAAPMLKYRRALYLDEAGQEVSFTVALARKDMELAAALARSLGTAMPQGQVTLDMLRAAEAQGHGARDMAAIVDFVRRETR